MLASFFVYNSYMTELKIYPCAGNLNCDVRLISVG